MEEMSYSDVAELLGVAVGTVRSRLHRARALLLARLSQDSLNPGRCPA
jgi:RNA polymerase sigma-70 factor (ECF subfamily)